MSDQSHRGAPTASFMTWRSNFVRAAERGLTPGQLSVIGRAQPWCGGVDNPRLALEPKTERPFDRNEDLGRLIFAYVTRDLGLGKREPKGCRWVIDCGPQERPWGAFCQVRQQEGSSFCPEHHAKAYQGTAPGYRASFAKYFGSR